MDEFRIDSHKLIFHPKEVSRWLAGEEIYPIYMEVSPSGACNHRCTFCALDFMEYKPRFLDTAILKERITEMGRLGVKSIMYGGEGEPFLHREIGEIIEHTKNSGIDVAVTTNSALFSEGLASKILGHVAWIKTSINAGTPEVYAAVHRTQPGDFDRVIANLSAAVRIRKETGSRCNLGAQSVLLPENAGSMEALAETARNIGLDYLVIKPYSQHHMSHTKTYRDLDYSDFLHLKDALSRFNTPDFKVIFRERTMNKITRTVRGYEKCMALPFWSYVDSGGNVWGCSAYLGNEQFRLGNINEQTFREIWLGERRKECMRYVSTDLDPEGCRMNCRMDEVNLYLWELTHPSGHTNFI